MASDQMIDASPVMSQGQSDINQNYMSPQQVSVLKNKIFELLKGGDMNNEEKINYDDFKAVINRYLPNASDDKMHAMFNELDSDHDGVISYVEFLDDDNFHQFLNYCGYFTSNVHNSHVKATESIGQIAELEMNRQFSVHNQHDKQIVQYQKETISKLNEWIQTTGKPAEMKANELQLEVDELGLKLQHMTYELEEMKNEVKRATEDRQQMSALIDTLETAKKELEMKLQDTHNALLDATKEIEEFGTKEEQIEGLSDEVEKLKQQITA